MDSTNGRDTYLKKLNFPCPTLPDKFQMVIVIKVWKETFRVNINSLVK